MVTRLRKASLTGKKLDILKMKSRNSTGAKYHLSTRAIPDKPKITENNKKDEESPKKKEVEKGKPPLKEEVNLRREIIYQAKYLQGGT